MADGGKDFHPTETYSSLRYPHTHSTIQEHENVLMLISYVNTVLTRRLCLVFWLKHTVSVLISRVFLVCFNIYWSPW